MVPLSKSGVRKHRGFESRPLRQTPAGMTPRRALATPVLAHALRSALALGTKHALRAPVLAAAFA
jgi:hypothetical protein